MTNLTTSRPIRNRLSFSVKINFILGIGLAILAAVGTFAYHSIDVLIDTGRLEGAALMELGRLETVTGSLKRAESAQRKYLITAKAEDLAEYQSAKKQVGLDIKSLRSQTVDLDQKHRLLELEALIAERLERLDSGVEVRKKQGPAAAAEIVRSPRAQELNQKILSLTDQFRQHEFRSLRSRQEDTAFNADITSFLIFWGTAFAVTLLVWAMVIIHRHQTGRRLAEQAVKASETQLRLITDAVPALIGYVDRDGRLKFHNRAFEHWFGRTPGQIYGHTLHNLLGEETYRFVEPQIALVLEGSTANFNFSLPGAGGRTLELSAQLVPRHSEQGEVVGYYALVTDITELKEVERMKSEFVTTVSHELRTPLTSIRGSLGLLAGGVTGVLSDKARELVTIAMENCERLVRLVNDILDSEKMLSEKMQLSFDVLDLSALIERSIKENDGFAAAHGVRVRFDSAGQEIKVRADPDRLVQVLTNLLSNACKFSPVGGAVEVYMKQLGETVKVSVNDRGPGVSEKFQDRLFERFAQFDSSDMRRRGGTGLGLSICRGIVERLGGTIGFAPREGGGSTFFFELPVWNEERAVA